MDDAILQLIPLDFVWATQDPFLFCVHHLDLYPRGNDEMGPAAQLTGRNLGMDFEGRDGWRMYHGTRVPGFPAHPHRGFETVTIARRGFIDHSDSLGAAARFGQGDVQWMTAGRGIVHSEMFPLRKEGSDNPVELFQIWLNLPRADKMVPAHFAMLWGDRIPVYEASDAAGRQTRVTVVAGELEGLRPPPPPPHSWAARRDSHVAIWSVRMQAGAEWTLPPVPVEARRTLYVFAGSTVRVAGREVGPKTGVALASDVAVPLVCGDVEAELLMLSGRPIGEPVAQHGPFVMNSPDEIRQAMLDYQSTRFGGWPWPRQDPVHSRERTRFARHADGREEQP